MAHASLYTDDLCEPRVVSDTIITWFPFDEPPPLVFLQHLSVERSRGTYHKNIQVLLSLPPLNDLRRVSAGR